MLPNHLWQTVPGGAEDDGSQEGEELIREFMASLCSPTRWVTPVVGQSD